ncbi:zinc ribbon domain-containing protein [Pseudomonas paraeruginosa]|uniref:zinc ribbon domain-containing protein n=1 Tax=Pseudomonas aeruginosa TaxID=287 RepID=UPI000D1BAC5A|nr:zinc ribbon domain-containing protein [Pseudomonas aeruginosa]PTC36380.1 hypothetical protein CLJ1_2873 [Pseudomonas aeruginosa]
MGTAEAATTVPVIGAARTASRRRRPAVACPSCRAANAATARFCQGCGGSLAPLRCGACQAEVAAAAKFCGACGAPQR